MFINAVLQKYPNTERPGALFEITNISSSYMQPYAKTDEQGRALFFAKNEMFTKSNNCNIKPPYKIVWFEYRWGNNSRGILVSTIENIITYDTFFNKSSNIIRLDRTLLTTNNFVFTDNTWLDYGSYRSLSELEELKTSNKDEQNRLYLQTFILPAIISQALLNCKNVSTDSHEFPNRRSIQHYKRIGKPYFEKYYTLKLTVPGSKKKREGKEDIESDGYTRAFHICRGHFKIYTDANPLFGKYTGTYWWNSQVRGDIKTGIIDKDYSLKQVNKDIL